MNPEDKFGMPYALLFVVVILTGVMVFFNQPIAHFITAFATL